MRLQTISRIGLAGSALIFLGAGDPAPGLDKALAAASAPSLLDTIKVLASDDFEGRAPGTPGEAKTVAYLIDAFKKRGLKPGNPDGTYVQDVPLRGFQAKAVTGSLNHEGRTIGLKFPDEWVAVSRRNSEEVRVENSEVVFVGYGVVAPEYGWDDYKGVDVRGKTIVMLVNDPPIPAPGDPSKLDPAMFKGKAMTYYGRWTYKFEIAAEKGAAAALLVHETGPAGYPYAVVVGSWARENYDIDAKGETAEPVAVQAWIQNDKAKEIFKASGHDFDALKNAAIDKNFKPVPLGMHADLSVATTLRKFDSKNVVARVEGSDPKLKDEYVVYTAHWDHLGRDRALTGDQIFNGAADNASGTAALVELAGVFAKLDPAPKRSILFLAVTAEEKGLLGAKYYATHPLYPLTKTLADINMDVINLWGRTKDVISVGLGQTTLDGLLAEAAKKQGRVVAGDPEPEKGLFYRSDHFEFAKQGVPALNAKGGVDYLDKPPGYGLQKRDEYTKNDYHKVTDEVKPNWDLAGAIEDLKLLAEVGHHVAETSKYPEWLPGTEFQAKRQAMLAAPDSTKPPARP